MLSTRIVGQAIARAVRQPRVWLQASTATIYAHRYDGPNDERSGILGGHESNVPGSWRFSVDVARAWERAFQEAGGDGTRKIALRSAITLSPDPGGVFDTLLGLARHGFGGSAGHGRQFMSWVHYEDFVAAVRWLIDRDEVEGAVNVAAPNPLPNAEFMRVLRGGVWRPVRAPCEQVDARDRCGLHADGNRAHFEEPSRCSSPAARAWLQVQVPGLARCSTRSVPSVEGRAREGACCMSGGTLPARGIRNSPARDALEGCRRSISGEVEALSRLPTIRDGSPSSRATCSTSPGGREARGPQPGACPGRE